MSAFLGASPALALTNPTPAEYDAITEHVYRGSPLKQTQACQSMCLDFWDAEHDGTFSALRRELLSFRATVGVMPSFTTINQISSTASPSVTWKVGSGSDVIYHEIAVPGALATSSAWNPNHQRIMPFKAGDVIKGLVTVPADGWAWNYGWSAGQRIYDVAPCPNGVQIATDHPPGYSLIGHGGQVRCNDGTDGDTQYAHRDNGLVMSTPEDSPPSGIGPTAAAPSNPGFATARSRVQAELSSDRYPVLNAWYDFVLGRPGSCDPSDSSSCRVPDCRSLSVPACEAALTTRGFATHSVQTNAGSSVDLGVGADKVAGTTPAAGSIAPVSAEIQIAANPAVPQWNDALLDRYRPELVYDNDEAFRADSPAIATDWHENRLIRANGPQVAPPTLGLEFLGDPYGDGRDATDLDRLDHGPPGADETDHSFTAYSMRSGDPAAYANKAYGRVADADGGIWIQYWLYYYFNPSPPGSLGAGAHEGDWELVQFRFTGDEATGLTGPIGPLGPDPVSAAAAAHTGGHTCPWAGVERSAVGAPRIYVAVDSHASYFGTGQYGLSTVTDDLVDGDGEERRPDEVVQVDGSEGWLEWGGQWGGTIPGSVVGIPDPTGSSSPPGPSHQSGGKWSDPDAWAGGLEFGGGCGGGSAAANAGTHGLNAEADRRGSVVDVTYEIAPRTGPKPGYLRALLGTGSGRGGVLTFEKLPSTSVIRGGLTLRDIEGHGNKVVRLSTYTRQGEKLSERVVQVTGQ